MKTKQLHIKVSEEVHKKLRIESATQGISLQAYLEALISREIAFIENQKKMMSSKVF